MDFTWWSIWVHTFVVLAVAYILFRGVRMSTDNFSMFRNVQKTKHVDHLLTMPEGDRLFVARVLLESVTAPSLHVEKMKIANEASRSADAMEREWGNV